MRSLERVEMISETDKGMVLRCLCDCTTITEVLLEGNPLEDTGDFAYTCDGCGTSHWMRKQVTWIYPEDA